MAIEKQAAKQIEKSGAGWKGGRGGGGEREREKERGEGGRGGGQRERRGVKEKREGKLRASGAISSLTGCFVFNLYIVKNVEL